MSAALNLRLSGKTFKHIGFRHSGGNPIVRGWWQYKDGEDGGELHIDTKLAEVHDCDGAYDLPRYVKKELKSLGITCDWDDE